MRGLLVYVFFDNHRALSESLCILSRRYSAESVDYEEWQRLLSSEAVICTAGNAVICIATGLLLTIFST